MKSCHANDETHTSEQVPAHLMRDCDYLAKLEAGTLTEEERAAWLAKVDREIEAMERRGRERRERRHG